LQELAGHTDIKFGRAETKKGSVAISRYRILGKWDHRGFVGYLRYYIAALPRDRAHEQ